MKATDNSGVEVKNVEVLVDDLSTKKTTGAELGFTWNTKELKTGKHTVDVVATNAKGQQSRRRFEMYAGDLFLLELGSRFTNEGTQVTLRNIAPESTKGQVKLEVRSAEGKVATDVAYTSTQASSHGAMAFVFGGKGKDGKPFATGRYEGASHVHRRGRTDEADRDARLRARHARGAERAVRRGAGQARPLA